MLTIAGSRYLIRARRCRTRVRLPRRRREGTRQGADRGWTTASMEGTSRGCSDARRTTTPTPAGPSLRPSASSVLAAASHASPSSIGAAVDWKRCGHGQYVLGTELVEHARTRQLGHEPVAHAARMSRPPAAESVRGSAGS